MPEVLPQSTAFTVKGGGKGPCPHPQPAAPSPDGHWAEGTGPGNRGSPSPPWAGRAVHRRGCGSRLFPGGWHVSRGTLRPGLPHCDDEGHGVRSPCFRPLGLTPLGGA